MDEIEILQHYNHKFLFIKGQLYMWDLPFEQEIQRNLARRAFGDVLVAGYGFGIVTKYILENPKVHSVVSVEKSPTVIEAMKKIGPIYGEIIVGDFLNLPEDKKYDCVVADTWAEIDSFFLEEYIRSKNKALKLLKPNGKFLGWGQDFFEYLLEKQKKAYAR